MDSTASPEARGARVASLPPSIRAPLARLRRREAMLCAANRGATALLAAAGALALAFALDRWWILSTSARTTITSLVFAVTAVMLARALVPLLRPSRWASVAKAVERHDASFRGEILSSVEIGLEAASGRSRWSTHLLEALFEQASRKLRGLEPGALYPARRTLLFGAAALAAWVALLVLALSQPQSTRLLARRLVHPWTDLPRPTTTLLELAPGSAVVARGDDVELVVRALRGEPSSALLAVHVDDAPEVEESRTFEAAALVRRFSAVRRSFEYQVSAGDFASPVYRIEVREPPRPVRFRITYRLPAYTHRAPEEVESASGDLSALQGTVADLSVSASAPLASARLEISTPGSETPRRHEMQVHGAEALAQGLVLDGPGAYRLFLETPDRVSNGGRAEFALRPLPDRPPVVDLLEPRSSEVPVEPAGFLRIRYEARDDVALEQVELEITVEGKKSSVGLTSGLSEYVLDVTTLGLAPGVSASISIRARDGLGQEAASSPRTLRVLPWPPPPEGAGWPAALAELSDSIDAALSDWKRLLASGKDAPPERWAPDAARAERLLEAADRTLGVMSFVRAISQRAREVGRAIETPSPNRRALEGLAALLIQWAEGEGPAFWTEAAACAGRLRAASGERRADGAGLAEDGSVPVARLFETHAAAGRTLEEALLDVRAVLGSEEVEETLERAWALEAELSSPAGAALGPGAVSDVGVLAATLASQASRDNTSPEELEASSRWLLESVLAAVRDPAAFVPARSATLQGLSALRAKLDDRLERSEKAAALARAELAAPPRIDTDLERFAAAQDRAAMLAAARDASLRLGLQMEAVEAMEYADLESASDLSAMRDAVQVLAEEDAARPDSPPALRRLLDVWNSTAPSRSIGRAIQDVDRAAGAQEDLATKLRSTPAGNSRTLRLLARTERELARLVESARSALESLRASAGKAAEGLPAAVEQAGRARSALSLSSDLLFRASDAALGPRPAAASELPEPLMAEALAAAGKAASELSPLPELLESLRSPAAPEVAEGRAWLRSLLGTLPERVARAAARARDHARALRSLATAEGESSPGVAASLASLVTRSDDFRDEVLALAAKIRREADRRFTDGPASVVGSTAALRAWQAAARRMAALASGDLADAARALRASTQQIPRAQAGSWMAASAAEERAADELTAVARALSALENEAVLDAASQDIAAAAASTRAPPVGDPALLAREAQAALEACLRAAERLAVETSADPRRASLLDFVRRAAESFREAVRLATEGAAAPAAERLAEGRALLDQASSLAAKMREEAGAGADAARTELAKSVDADKDDPSAPSSSKELEAAYSELDRILELERAGKEVAAQLEQLFASDPGADPARTEAAMRELEEKMEGGSLSTAELVELIAKLVAIDRDGREAVQAERALAADAEKLFPHADGPPNEPPRVDDGGLRALADGHTATAQRVRNLAARLRETGFKLSAVLPNVLKAYWQATAAVEPALRAVDAAGDALARSEPPQRLLLDAASRLDDWLNGVGAMRRQALEAVADAERGTGSAGANSAHSSLERARQSLAEAARLGKSGDAGAARRLGAQSLRSIADAAGLLRAQISELTIPAGDEGRLLSRVLDEEAASLGLGWSVLTRGSAPLDAARLGQPAPGEMPFPASYREWVKVYLQALTEE